MIHLDTNYLIGLLVKGSPEAGNVDGWMAAGIIGIDSENQTVTVRAAQLCRPIQNAAA